MFALTQEQFVEKIKVRHEGTIKILSRYENSRSWVKYKCVVCGYTDSKYANNLLQGQGCRGCAKKSYREKRSIAPQELKKHMLRVTNYEIIKGEVTNNGTTYKEHCRVEVRCKVCNRTRTVVPFLFRNVPKTEKYYKHGCCTGGTSANNSAKQAVRCKEIKLNGKWVSVQGYEPFAIDYIRDVKGIAEKDIVVDRTLIPRIPFSYQGKQSVHLPDLFIPKKNIIVEVKSTYTAGLLAGTERERRSFTTLKSKRQNAVNLGYKYYVLVMNQTGERIELPSDWYSLSHKQIRAWYLTQ